MAGVTLSRIRKTSMEAIIANKAMSDEMRQWIENPRDHEVIDTDDVPEADWLRYCDEAASVTTAATAYYWRVYHATSGADLGVYAGPTQDDAIRAYTQATDDSESAGAYSAEPESGGWTVCLTDGREIAVPAELDEDIVRYGVSAIVEWAREAGWAADGRRVRTIGTPDGQGITQF